MTDLNLNDAFTRTIFIRKRDHEISTAYTLSTFAAPSWLSRRLSWRGLFSSAYWFLSIISSTLDARPPLVGMTALVRERLNKKVEISKSDPGSEKVKPDDGLKDAIGKMDHGHFRHLPVVDEHERLIGMLTDRDVRQIRPSLAFTTKEEVAVQLWSISVQQAAVFDPISVKPDSSLREAAELMLRWHVGGLPVIDDHERVVGMLTYTDLLREFVGREENH